MPMIVVPVPVGQMPIGPALFQLFGILAVIVYFAWLDGREEKHKKGPSPEELMEKRKQDAFYKALTDAAQKRKITEEKA